MSGQVTSRLQPGEGLQDLWEEPWGRGVITKAAGDRGLELRVIGGDRDGWKG